MNRRKINIWLLLIPVYILAAIPAIKLLLKLYSPDLPLTRQDMEAFSGSGKIESSTYKHYEPDFSDLDYAVSYKTQGTRIEENRKAEEKSYTGVQKHSLSPRQEKKEVTRVDASTQKDLQQQQMMAIGFKKGFLTSAVGSLINDPKKISALFNNPFVVEGFMSRDTVKNLLSDPSALENFLTKTNAVNNFLNNSVVQTALKNPQIVSAVMNSELGKAILNSHSVQEFLKDPDRINRVINSNPQVMTLLTNPLVASTLMSNPQTANVFMQIQSGR